MSKQPIVIDARIRRASTGRPVDRLLDYLPQLDSDYRYTILLQPDDPWKAPGKDFMIRYISYPQYSANPLQQLAYSWRLYRLKPDLVHFTQTGQQPLFYLGRQITMTHDLTMYEYVRPGRRTLWWHKIRMAGYRLLMWAAHRKAKHIIVPTEYVKEGLSAFHPFTKNKITVTLESTEPPLNVAASPLKGVTKPFIFHVGSPFPHKNIERLIEAFEILAEKYPDLQLVLPGKKEHYFEQLQKQVDASPVAGRILVPGFVTDAELKWLYQNAEAYALPSLSEGFGLPGLEAMAHGCALVSSDATCLPEVYGDAAHYFDPKNVADMAAKIGEVLDSKSLRASLIQKGNEQVKKYSWRRMAEQTLAVYKLSLD
jgi:glycosyltransferase involved in cell wall biosynthesis